MTFKTYDEVKHIVEEKIKKGKKEGLVEGELVGIDKGLVEGKQERNIEIAKNMLKINPNDIKMIHQVTGLTIVDIEKIKEDMGL